MSLTYLPIQIVAKAMFLICLMTPWSAAGQQPEIATMVAFTEGPAVDQEGNVYFHRHH